MLALALLLLLLLLALVKMRRGGLLGADTCGGPAAAVRDVGKHC
jgi:hypothetical protein